MFSPFLLQHHQQGNSNSLSTVLSSLFFKNYSSSEQEQHAVNNNNNKRVNQGQNDPSGGTFMIAAAYGISKNATQSTLESSLTYHADNDITPEPPANSAKDSVCGEDAYFIANVERFKARAVGIADGVGGWVSSGVDPGLISRKLMQFSQAYVLQQQQQHKERYSVLDRVGVNDNASAPNYALSTLQYAYDHVTNTRISKIRAGSTTACIVYVTENGVLHSANLGDSGFMVLRNEEIIYRSTELQHRFNAPYQIAVCPPFRQGNCIMNTPQQAALHKLQLKNGDMIIVGTDGLFDNQFDDQIVEIVKYTKQNWLPKIPIESEMSPIAIQHRYNFEMAKNLCLYTKMRTHVQNPKNKTPFGVAYEKEYNQEYANGAKIDDICCIVCTVHSE